MLKKSIFVFAAAVMMLSVMPVGADLPDIVATVNGENITKEDLIKALVDWNAPMALEQLIMYHIVDQAAKKANVNITAEEIESKLNEMKQTLPPDQDFEEVLRRNGLTMAHARQFFGMQLQSEGVIREGMEFSDEVLGGYRRASHILLRVSPGANAEEREANEKTAREKIEQIAKEIEEGLSFEDAASQHSEDPMSKERGGDLDYFGRNEMMPEFEEAVFSLEKGKLSEPIKTAFGYHLIKVTGIGNEAEGDDLEELKDRIMQREFSTRYQDWLLQVRNQAEVVNFVVPEKKAATPPPSDTELPPPPPPVP